VVNKRHALHGSAESWTLSADGHDLAELDADAMTELRRNTFRFIFQRYNLLGNTMGLN
jgi:ABC-type lipoprotein export system ATPase subunit